MHANIGCLAKNSCDKCGRPLGEVRLIAGTTQVGNHFCSIACYDGWRSHPIRRDRNETPSSER
jgi:hypothetical protein